MPEEVKKILENLKAFPKKALGQNFLINKTKINKISEELLKYDTDEIIEIGPGLGAITEKIAHSKKRIICIEKDGTLYDYLVNKFIDSPDLHVIKKDILNTSLKKIRTKKKAIVFGNLPYNIASQIVIKFVDEFYMEKVAGIFMFQKEVAERILSAPKSKAYNAFTLKIQSFFEIKKILSLNEADFWPPPKIKSTFVLLRPKTKNKKIYENYTEFNAFLTLSFSSKRKTLINNLQKNFPREKILLALKKISKKENIRAEELDNEDFFEIFYYLKNQK